MTKADVMASFEACLTVDDVTRDALESHMPGPYRAIATSGSSGLRGLFVYDRAGLVDWALSFMRFVIRDDRRDPRLAGGTRVLVGGTDPHHASTQALGALRGLGGDSLVLGVGQPLDRIVARLNAARPATLMGTASVLEALAVDPTLTIAPGRVVASSEPLTPEAERAIADRWRAPIAIVYATTEGLIAGSCGREMGLHVNDDLCIVEPVDERGEPVPTGTPAAKLYVTNLYNHVQPLIRYELDDAVTFLAGRCACGSHMRRIANVAGRVEDRLRYGDIVVHPQAIRLALLHDRHLVGYQVRQTPSGASIRFLADGDVDVERLRRSFTALLAGLGVPDPVVDVERVADLPREPTGKIRRIVPL
jgi:phenylacetate-coenzyme A ligase PaaK-like adenylate-forming protein